MTILTERRSIERHRVGPVADRWLNRPSSRARVHSVFDRVINLRTSSDDLVCLSLPDVPLTPFTLEVSSLPTDCVSTGQVVRFRAGTLREPEGRWEVSAHERHRWRSGDLSEPVGRERLVQVVPQIARALNRRTDTGGLLGLLGPSGVPLAEDRLNDPFLIRGSRALRRLETAWERSDPETLREAARDLVGLGPGTTPSGDDALVGFAAALVGLEPSGSRDAVREFVDVLLEVYSTSASWFSNQWLRAAARGEYARPLVNLWRWVGTGSGEQSLSVVLEDLGRLGSSSGFDLCVGFLVGLRGRGQRHR